ncbi:MAG TPA: pyridoxal-phosphate dependent enzyme [Bryobacteraceae bacterium]|jgi:threonine synthase
MSFVTELVCDQCHAPYSHREPILLCRSCGGVLDPQYDLDTIAKVASLERILSRKPGVWRWREFLPVSDEKHFIDIGAAASPLIECPQLSRWIGAQVFVKYEGQQPTGSLKDRSFAVAVSKAAELGVRGAITYSSGNAAASLAAHANHIGMRGLILVNAWADRAKLAAIHAFGMPIILLDWRDFREVEALMVHAIRELGLFAFVNFQNPWRHDGYKTYAYENWLDLGRRVPDHQIHPIGTGGGIFGSWKGYQDLRAIGWTSAIPRLHGTQPSACGSLVTAFRAGKAEAVPEGDPTTTIAEAVANNVPLDAGRRPLRAIAATNGEAVAVTDDEMRDGIRRLGQEGIFAEPAGASTVWAARHLAKHGVIRPGEIVVLQVTATGLKQAEALPVGDLPRIEPKVHDLERIVRQWMI